MAVDCSSINIAVKKGESKVVERWGKENERLTGNVFRLSAVPAPPLPLSVSLSVYLSNHLSIFTDLSLDLMIGIFSFTFFDSLHSTHLKIASKRQPQKTQHSLAFTDNELTSGNRGGKKRESQRSKSQGQRSFWLFRNSVTHYSESRTKITKPRTKTPWPFAFRLYVRGKSLHALVHSALQN